MFTGSVYAQDNAPPAEFEQLISNAKKLLLTQPDSMIIYSDKAYQLALQNHYEEGIAIALKLKAVYEYRKSNFDRSISYYNQSLAIFNKLKNNLEIGKAYLNIAISYQGKNDFVNVAANCLKALPYFEKLKDDNGQGRVLNLLGVIAFEQHRYKKANEYFFQYNALVKKSKDTTEIGSSYNNIARTYQELHQVDSAMLYNEKALTLNKLIKNEFGKSKNYQNLGELYASVKKYDRALYYNKLAMEICQRLGDQKFLSHNYSDIGINYLNLKDTVNGLKWINKSMDIAKKVGENEVLSTGYRVLSDIEASQRQYKVAYTNLVSSSNARDSVLNISTSRTIEELKTRYETEKKENQIKLLRQQTILQRLQIRQRNTYLVTAILLLIIGAGISYLIYSRRKAREQIALQQEVSRQREIAAREVLNAEERERRRMGSDLHDGVGQLLSSALLNLNRLHTEPSFEEQRLLSTQTLSLITESYDEIRSISHQIIPNVLVKHGLSIAISDFLEKIGKHSIKVSFDTDGLTGRLPEQTETILYRIIQEAVTNIIKHAQASKLSIQLIKDAGGINLAIEDNGKGFDTSRLQNAKGIGMKNIYSRVAYLKGSIDIQSDYGKGTLIAIFIPQ